MGVCNVRIERPRRSAPGFSFRDYCNDMAKPGNAIHIPLPFEDTIAAVLKVKPPPKISKAKVKTTPRHAGAKQATKN